MKEDIKKEGLEWLKAFVIGIIIFAFIRTFFFSNYIVKGESMMPTLQDGNKLVVNKIGYQFGKLQRFDVIVFHANKKEDFVKRIIGLPGDKIEYRNDQLYVNDKKIDEPYLDIYRKQIPGGRLTGDFTLKEITGEEKVPPGKLFVLGDNRLGSWDSRQFGFISVNQVVGKVNLRYWPLNEIDVSF
ncbi:signal peptidase I [Bacillus methanolicus]|uniref:Signal peptidase I n=1 Tax=Bacillus methanolicus (strain MGA3 / ATCC 53907) TaxID=796606 RepID=I3E7J2_BACMM|nr:signal peptidase I [Bacillus methanolicus]AIE59289.1 Signal peptidase I [Bacillus methanolicus MGA3]EIJ82463.1 signal peptidase I [Bacillus methanolicus MGA3]